MTMDLAGSPSREFHPYKTWFCPIWGLWLRNL